MRARALLLAVALTLAIAPPAVASFPGRNGLIAVSGEVPGSNTATIWVGRAAGHAMRALPSPCLSGPLVPAASCFADAPAWSADGRRVAFTVLDHLQPQLWIVNADGSDLHPLPGARGYNPAWSPRGTRLVFSADAADQDCLLRNLYTVAPDGSGLRLLTRGGDNADWSVRGEIAYERERTVFPSHGECEERHAIAVMRPGGRPRRVAPGSYPSWAPGGHAIVLSGSGGLRRVQIGAGGPGRLLARGALVYESSWSPDGRRIVYRRSNRVRLIGARRGRPIPLAFDPPGTDFSSSWQPLPR